MRFVNVSYLFQHPYILAALVQLLRTAELDVIVTEMLALP